MWVFILWAGVALDVLRVFNRLVDLELILLRTYSPTDWWDITRTLGPCGGVIFKYGLLGAKILRSEMNFSNNGIKQIETVVVSPSLLAVISMIVVFLTTTYPAPFFFTAKHLVLAPRI